MVIKNLFNGSVPRPPGPNQIIAPLVGIESAVINAVTAPAIGLRIPLPPIPPGPMAVFSQILSRLPRP